MRVKTYLRRERNGELPKQEFKDDVGVYEYPDALLTLYINVLFNNSNIALRRGIDEMLKRIESPRVRHILTIIKRAPIPIGKLNFFYSALEQDLGEIKELSNKNPS